MKIWKLKRKKFRREPGMILKTEISSVCFLKTTENLYRFDNFLYTYFDAIDLPHGVLSVFQSRFASLQTWISGLRMSIWAAGGAKSPTIMRYEVAFRQSVRNDRLTDAGAVSKCHWKKTQLFVKAAHPVAKIKQAGQTTPKHFIMTALSLRWRPSCGAAVTHVHARVHFCLWYLISFYIESQCLFLVQQCHSSSEPLVLLASQPRLN